MTLFFLFCAGSVQAGETDGARDLLGTASSALRSWLADQPNWMGRIDTGLQFGEDIEPEFYLETVQPLRQTPDRAHTWFVQPRVGYREDDGDLYNLGAGYRRYLERQNALAGLNLFGDFENRHDHGRLGIGLEWLSTPLDLRMNVYVGLTPRRQVGTVLTGPVFEKVADGLDFEAGVPVPYLSGVKLFGGGQIYFFDETETERYGWRARLEIKPLSWTTVNLGLRDDNDGPAEWRFDIRVSLGFGAGGTTPDQPSKADARDRALDRVEREHRLVKERFGEGLSFFVAKA